MLIYTGNFYWNMALWFKFVYGSNLVLISIVLVRVTLLNSSLNKISRNLIVDYTLACAHTGWSIKMNRIKVLLKPCPFYHPFSPQDLCFQQTLWVEIMEESNPSPGWMVFNQIYFYSNHYNTLYLSMPQI